jgi:hypothetical protein
MAPRGDDEEEEKWFLVTWEKKQQACDKIWEEKIS